MSVLKNKRTTSKMEYVTNAYAIEKYSLDFTKRLSVKNARLFQEPIKRLAMFQSDTAYLANEFYPTNKAEYQLRRILLNTSTAVLHVLDKRMADVYEILMVNPSEAFNRQNGKPISKEDAIKILDKLCSDLGDMIDNQDKLLKGVRDADKGRFNNLPPADSQLATILNDIAKSLSTSLISLFL